MTFREWIVAAGAVAALLQWLMIPHLLAQRCKSPNATLAWLWSLIFIPGIGLFYFLMGNERVQRKRLALVRALDSQLEATPVGSSRKRRAMMAAAMPDLERVNGMPATGGNSASLLTDGTSFFPVMLEVIQNAKHHLHLEFYIWRNDRAGRTVRDALVKAAQRGVEVRVLVDEMGSFFTRRRLFAPLVAAGGTFSWFNSISLRRWRFNLNLRNHRKLVVADGTTALTGGMNVADEYWRGNDLPPYRDLGVRLNGPLVSQLAEVFAQDWFFSTGQPLTSVEYYPAIEACGEVGAQVVAGAPDNDIDEVQLSTIALIHRAEKRTRLITPYFVPERALLAALQLAGMRGVDVALLVPEKCDRFYLTHVMRSYYDDLLPHGIRILEYQPRMIHAKALTVDGLYTMAGSANLDIRSLRINFELNVLLTCKATTQAADQFFDQTAAESHAVTLEEYQRRPLRHKIAEAVFRPLAPLL